MIVSPMRLAIAAVLACSLGWAAGWSPGAKQREFYRIAGPWIGANEMLFEQVRARPDVNHIVVGPASRMFISVDVEMKGHLDIGDSWIADFERAIVGARPPYLVRLEVCSLGGREPRVIREIQGVD